MDKKQVLLTRNWVLWVTVVLVGLLLIGGIMGAYALGEKDEPFREWVIPLANAVILSSITMAGYYVINLTIDHFVYMEKIADKNQKASVDDEEE